MLRSDLAFIGFIHILVKKYSTFSAGYLDFIKLVDGQDGQDGQDGHLVEIDGMGIQWWI